MVRQSIINFGCGIVVVLVYLILDLPLHFIEAKVELTTLKQLWYQVVLDCSLKEISSLDYHVKD